MWYKNLIKSLIIAKIPQKDRAGAASFLEVFFTTLYQENYSDEPTLSVEMLLRVIAQLYTRFKDTDEVPLTQFAPYLLTLAFTYAKLSDEQAIWNVDYIPVFEAVRRFLGLEEQMAELYEDFRSERKRFNSKKKNMTFEQKAINFLLNKLEREFLAELHFNLTLDLFKVEIIFCQFATLPDLQSFYTQTGHLLAGGSTEFEDLTLAVLLGEMRVFGNTLLYPEYREAFSIPVLEAELAWKGIQEEIIQPSCNETAIREMKNSLKQRLLEVTENFLFNCGSVEIIHSFYRKFSLRPSFLAPLLEKISRKLSISDPLVVALRELTDFASKLRDEKKQQIFLKFIGELTQQLDFAISRNQSELDTLKVEIQQRLLRETKAALLEKTSVSTMRLFCKKMTSPLFASLKTQTFLQLTEIERQPLLSVKPYIDSICTVLRLNNYDQHALVLTELAKKLQGLGEVILYESQRSDVQRRRFERMKAEFQKVLHSYDALMCPSYYGEIWKRMLNHAHKALKEIETNLKTQESSLNSHAFFEKPDNKPGDEPDEPNLPFKNSAALGS